MRSLWLFIGESAQQFRRWSTC